MEELLDQLIKKAANETEEAHRHYIAALNGLAGELRSTRRLPILYIYIFLKLNFLQCCGSGIRCLFDPLDPGSEMGKKIRIWIRNEYFRELRNYILG
jgi:hypothetical protein